MRVGIRIGLGTMDNLLGWRDNLRQGLGESGAYLNPTKFRQKNSINSILGATGYFLER